MTNAQQKAREIAEELYKRFYPCDPRRTYEGETYESVIAQHIGLAGIDFVCAHCGALAWINETSIDTGCTLICVQCNGESVVELHTPKSYTEREGLRPRLDLMRKQRDIAIQHVNQDLREAMAGMTEKEQFAYLVRQYTERNQNDNPRP